MKFLLNTLNKIKTIEKTHSGTISKPKSPLDGINANLKPIKNHFELEFQIDLFSPNRKMIQVGVNYKNVEYKIKSNTLIFSELFINMFGPPRVKGSVSQFHTKGFSKKKNYYYRIIIPTKKELPFHYSIEHTSYSSDLGYNSALSTEVNFEDKKIELYSIHHKDRTYAVIDVTVKMNYDSFSQIVFAMLVSYGYITGFMPGEKGYYITYGNAKMDVPNHILYRSMRETTNSSYQPLKSNAFAMIREKGKKAEKINAMLRPLSIQEFSNLFALTHNSLDFSSVLLLILESSVASLLFMPGGCAMALEALSDMIVGKNKPNLAPIKDKVLSKKVVRECQEIIVKYCDSIIDKADLDLLKERISSNLNKPTNKVLLKAPFDLLDIKLYPEDLILLGTRNDFLHGRIPDMTKAGTNRSLERLNYDLFYCSLRFYTLLNMLILKWIGYDNYVINYPKLQSRYTKIKLPNEQVFRKV